MTVALERLVALATNGDLAAADALAAELRRGRIAPGAADALDSIGDALLVVLAARHRSEASPPTSDGPSASQLPRDLERAGESWVALDFPVARAVVTVDTPRARRNAPGHAGSPTVWRDALRWLATEDGAPFLERVAATATLHDPADVVTTGAQGDGSWPLAALGLATAVWVECDDDGPWLADGDVLAASKSDQPRPHWRLGFAGGLFARRDGHARLTAAQRYLALRRLTRGGEGGPSTAGE